MTYNVFGGTLNLAQSISALQIYLLAYLLTYFVEEYCVSSLLNLCMT